MPEEADGGQENGRTEDVGAASSRVARRRQSFSRDKSVSVLDACDPASCGHGLAACGSDGAGCPATGQHLADCVPLIP